MAELFVRHISKMLSCELVGVEGMSLPLGMCDPSVGFALGWLPAIAPARICLHRGRTPRGCVCNVNRLSGRATFDICNWARQSDLRCDPRIHSQNGAFGDEDIA